MIQKDSRNERMGGGRVRRKRIKKREVELKRRKREDKEEGNREK